MADHEVGTTVEYVIQHFYEVKVDETCIDEMSEYFSPDDIQRFHRMFQSILSDKRTFDLVTYYIALESHYDESQAAFDFHEIKLNVDEFENLLVKIARRPDTCFHPDDARWLLDLNEKYDQAKQTYERLCKEIDQEERSESAIERYNKRQLYEARRNEAREAAGCFSLGEEVEPLYAAFGGYDSRKEKRNTNMTWNVGRVTGSH